MISTSLHKDAEFARKCLAGTLIAEELPCTARELVVTWLNDRGCSDVEVAAITGMSTYTAFRIRTRLGLPVRRDCS